jgi:hypothetical protein
MTPLGFAILDFSDQISGLEPNTVQDRELKRGMDELMELNFRKAEAAVAVGVANRNCTRRRRAQYLGWGSAPDGTSSRPP